MPRRSIAAVACFAAALVGGGAGARAQDEEPDRADLPARPGKLIPGAHVFLTIKGRESDEDKVNRCREIAEEYKLVLDPAAEARGTLTLEDEANSLSVSLRKNRIYFHKKGGWSMTELCRDAFAHLLIAVAQDRKAGGGVPPAPSPGAPVPPGYRPPPGYVNPPSPVGYVPPRAPVYPPVYTPPSAPVYVPPPAPVYVAPAPQPAAKAPPPPMPATGKPRAKALHTQAAAALERQEYTTAIDAWSEAYTIDPRPQFLFNLGSAFQLRGEEAHHLPDLLRARDYFQRYKTTPKHVRLDPDLMPRLDREIRELSGPPPAR